MGGAQEGRFDLLGVWFLLVFFSLFSFFFLPPIFKEQLTEKKEVGERKCRNTNVNVICS